MVCILFESRCRFIATIAVPETEALRPNLAPGDWIDWVNGTEGELDALQKSVNPGMPYRSETLDDPDREYTGVGTFIQAVDREEKCV